MRLRIGKAVYGGMGLARIEDETSPLAGKAVFVPFTLPGEIVDAHIVEDKRSFATAELDAVIEPSAARTAPDCPYFQRCGGCHYQHASYAEQLRLKSAILKETLERAKLRDLPEIAAVHAEPWRYRNRIRLLVASQPQFGLCYRERGSHASLPVSQCPIAAPLLERAIAAITRLGADLRVNDLCQEIEFFTNASEDSLLLSFLHTQAPSGAASLLRQVCSALQSELPQLRGAALFVRAKEEQAGSIVARWGEPSLEYTAAGECYRVSAGSFFQVNRLLVDSLVSLVAEGRAGRSAWDLYAGVGLFARALARRFERVTAVEAAPLSAADLERNLAGLSCSTARITSRDFLRRQMRSTGATPDLAVVDPPRSGLGDEVCALLAKAAPRQIVYVSCDPATLSRDLRALIQSGYCLQSLHLVDLFPQTYHLETVAALSLG